MKENYFIESFFAALYFYDDVARCGKLPQRACFLYGCLHDGEIMPKLIQTSSIQ